MKFKTLLWLLMAPALLFSKSSQVSPIPLPTTYVQTLNPDVCDEECMKQELKDGKIFSFMAHSHKPLSDQDLHAQKVENRALFNVAPANTTQSTLGTSAPISNVKVKIALIMPYKIIGRYATSTSNAVFAYMLSKNTPFEIKTFDIDSESSSAMQSAVSQIQNEGFSYAIAPVTKNGANALIGLNSSLNIYIPTINKNDVSSSSEHLFFGGIDYNAQMHALMQEAASPLIIFEDDSAIASTLSSYAKEQYISHSGGRIITYDIDKSSTNLKSQLKDNGRIAHGSFVTNTPIIKTGMIVSQLTLYDVAENNILSTQINYDPLILSMTQYGDRKNMIVANSISINKDMITEANALLSNDIVYDWINYSTTVGIDLFFNAITNTPREYPLSLVNNQISYPINLVKPSYARFVDYKSTEE